MPSSESLLQSLRAIEDVPMTLLAELDRKLIRFRDLMALQIDHVVSFSRPAGENVDLYAGDIHLGSGEILLNDSILALRIADLGDIAETPGVLHDTGELSS